MLQKRSKWRRRGGKQNRIPLFCCCSVIKIRLYRKTLKMFVGEKHRSEVQDDPSVIKGGKNRPLICPFYQSELWLITACLHLLSVHTSTLSDGCIEGKLYFLGGLAYHPQYLRKTRTYMPFPSLCAQLLLDSCLTLVVLKNSVEVVGMHHYCSLKPLKQTHLHINYTIDTLLLWEQVPKNSFSGRSDTAPGSQRLG